MLIALLDLVNDHWPLNKNKAWGHQGTNLNQGAQKLVIDLWLSSLLIVTKD